MKNSISNEARFDQKWLKGEGSSIHRNKSLLERLQDITIEHIMACFSGIICLISLILIVSGMAQGYWPGKDTPFLFLTLLSSSSGLSVLFVYLTSFIMFYYFLARVDKRFRIVKKRNGQL